VAQRRHNRDACFFADDDYLAYREWLGEATLFYGSRIRDYSSLVPKINITAIFAETEPSFSPDQIARVIARDNVRTFIEPGTFHGFMNPRSTNFAATQCAAHLQVLAAELERFHFHLARR